MGSQQEKIEQANGPMESMFGGIDVTNHKLELQRSKARRASIRGQTGSAFQKRTPPAKVGCRTRPLLVETLDLGCFNGAS